MTYQTPEIIEIGKAEEAILGPDQEGEIDFFPLAYPSAGGHLIDE